jgi:hypothetical protein
MAVEFFFNKNGCRKIFATKMAVKNICYKYGCKKCMEKYGCERYRLQK